LDNLGFGFDLDQSAGAQMSLNADAGTDFTGVKTSCGEGLKIVKEL
jgi:hypothetical protein